MTSSAVAATLDSIPAASGCPFHQASGSSNPEAAPTVRPFDAIPGEPGMPVLGNTIPLMTRPISFLDAWYKKYGPISRTRTAGQDVLMLLGPEMNQLVLLDRDKLFSSREGMSFYMVPFFTDGLVLWDFDEHQWHRGIMREAFRRDRLAEYVQAMNPIIEGRIERWLQTRGGRRMEKRTVFFFRRFKKTALDIATNVFMGSKVDSKEGLELIQAFQDTVAASVAFVRYPIPGNTHWRGLRSRKLLEKYFYDNIAEKRANPSPDFFSQLCVAKDDDGNKFNDEQVVNHMIFLMMAAHDTTTITTTRIVYHLAKHPEWQEKLRAESRALGKDFIDAEDIPNMRGIEMSMKEALRMLAPVPGLPRKTVRDSVIAGYHVPKGTVVQVDLRYTQYMEAYWPEPHKFDPSRFADGGQENKLHKHAWLPFGGGAHKCIGRHFADYQVKAFMHQMLLKYRWSVGDNYKMPIKNPGLPMPGDGFPLKIERL